MNRFKIVLGKEYKRGKKALAVVIKDLVNHPNCRDFVAERLCRFLITDEPTKEMKQPIINAFKKSDGNPVVQSGKKSNVINDSYI